MQIGQQIAGMMEGLKGGEGGSNGQGSTEVAPTSDGGARLKLEGGAEFYAEDEEDENQVKLAQTADSIEAIMTLQSGLDKILAETNVQATIFDQVTVSTSPITPPTDILLAGIAGDSPSQISEALALSQEYYGSSGISGAVISDLSGGQFVKLIEHSLSISGEKIVVDIFKSFDSLDGNGEELWVRNGRMNMKFEGVKIYYSRKIDDSPHSFGMIANSKDKERVFNLLEYRDNRGRLTDVMGRISVGDMSVEHPRESGLVVAKVREGMWTER